MGHVNWLKMAPETEQPNSLSDFLCTSLTAHSKTFFYQKSILTTDIIKHIKQFSPDKSTGSAEIFLKFNECPNYCINFGKYVQ